MIRLLSIELFKLRYNKASKVLIICYFSLLSCIALVSSLEINFGPLHLTLADQGIFEFPFIWHFNTYFAALPKVFLLLVIIAMVSNEYSNKTLKQNLIDGLSKKEYILSKAYMVIVMSLASTLFVFLVSLLLGLLFSTDKSISLILTDLMYFVAFFVKLISFFSIGLFMGIWIKRSAFAIGALFILYITEGIIGLFINSNLPTETAAFIKSLLPFNSSERLIPSPISRLDSIKELTHQLGEASNKDYSVPFLNIVVSLMWSALFIYAAYTLLKRRDL